MYQSGRCTGVLEDADEVAHINAKRYFEDRFQGAEDFLASTDRAASDCQREHHVIGRHSSHLTGTPSFSRDNDTYL